MKKNYGINPAVLTKQYPLKKSVKNIKINFLKVLH